MSGKLEKDDILITGGGSIGIPYIVPNNDPLLFYRKIGQLGLTMLKEGGMLAFEINYAFGKEVKALLEDLGYQDVKVMQDISHNDRFVFARFTISH